jgi:hypothetical protein
MIHLFINIFNISGHLKLEFYTTSIQIRPIYWHISATFVNCDFSEVDWNFESANEYQNMKDSLSEIRFRKNIPTSEKSQFTKKLAKLK